jgi:hypothetical protein
MQETPNKPKTFDRAAYLAAGKVRIGSAKLPDGSVAYFRSLSQSEMAAFDFEFLGTDGEIDRDKWTKERQPRMLAKVLCDEAGRRIFGDNEWQIVTGIDSAVMGRIFRAVAKHLGLDADDEDDPKK